MSNAELKEWNTVKAAAIWLSTSRATIYEWIKTEKLDGRRVSDRKTLVSKASIMALLGKEPK